MIQLLAMEANDSEILRRSENFELRQRFTSCNKPGKILIQFCTYKTVKVETSS